MQVWRSIAPRIRAYFYRYGRSRDLDSIVDEHRELLETLQRRAAEVLLDLLGRHIAARTPALDGRRV